MLLDAQGKPISRRGFLLDMLEGVGYVVGAASLPILPSLIGCAEPVPTDERGRWYFERRQDLLQTFIKGDPVGVEMNRIILNAVDKLSRGILPYYLPYPDAAHPGELIGKTMEQQKKKKVISILDPYMVEESGAVRIFNQYVGDFITGCFLSNQVLGSNFVPAERKDLGKILDEIDFSTSRDFNMTTAKQKGLFLPGEAVLLGNIYISGPTYKTQRGDNSVEPGGAYIIIRLVDVDQGTRIANGNERFPRVGLVEEWISESTFRR